MTQAQRHFAPSYQEGMAIQPEKDYRRAGLVRGETYRVKQALPGNVLVLKRPDNTTVTINLRKIIRLSVYHLERTELSVGDTIRINRNDPGRDLTNGDRLRVAQVQEGVVTLEAVDPRSGQALRAQELPTDRPLHLEHAYASTVHKG